MRPTTLRNVAERPLRRGGVTRPKNFVNQRVFIVDGHGQEYVHVSMAAFKRAHPRG
jgi:hypothetical protein